MKKINREGGKCKRTRTKRGGGKIYSKKEKRKFLFFSGIPFNKISCGRIPFMLKKKNFSGLGWGSFLHYFFCLFFGWFFTKNFFPFFLFRGKCVKKLLGAFLAQKQVGENQGFVFSRGKKMLWECVTKFFLRVAGHTNLRKKTSFFIFFFLIFWGLPN